MLTVFMRDIDFIICTDDGGSCGLSVNTWRRPDVTSATDSQKASVTSALLMALERAGRVNNDPRSCRNSVENCS